MSIDQFVFQLVKNAQLHPPIDYKTPEGYRILLEPIDHFSKGVNTSIFSKFTAINEDGKVYITVNDDLEDVLTNDATIVYKLKVSNRIFDRKRNVVYKYSNQIKIKKYYIVFNENNIESNNNIIGLINLSDLKYLKRYYHQ